MRKAPRNLLISTPPLAGVSRGEGPPGRSPLAGRRGTGWRGCRCSERFATYRCVCVTVLRGHTPAHAYTHRPTSTHGSTRRPTVSYATAGVRRSYRRQADHPTERAARPRDREHRFCVCESAVAVWGAGLCPATGDAGLGCMAGDAVRLERVLNLTKSEKSAAQSFDKYTPACGGLPGGRPPGA